MRLSEFAPAGGGGGDRDWSDEELKQFAAEWRAGDENRQIEQLLRATGWDIGWAEGYIENEEDEPGVFVMASDETEDKTYQDWPPDELEQLVPTKNQDVAEGSLNEASSDEAWELVGQPVPEIQQFVKQMGYGNDEQSIAKITSIIDRVSSTQIPATSIPKLKNLANKGNDAQTLKAIQQISGRPDAEQQYTKLMQARDAGEGRNRDVSGYIQYVKSGNYDPPVLLKLPTGVYVIGGRTRLYAALALGVPANVKIISANNFKQGVAEGSELSTSTLTGEIPTAMGPRKREQRELIEKYALYNKERDYFELFSELSDKPMPEIYNMNDSHQLAYELYNLGSQIASDWKNIGNPTFSRREYLIQIMADWYNLFKKSIQKYKSMAQGVAEGGPYDLPGKDYDRAGDAPHKPSRAKNNPYPFSKEEDDDYFREIFRKKREAKEKDKDVAEDWNKVNHHDHTNGLSQKAVNSYRREHPGSKLKTAVTTKPSKLKAGSKAAKRRKSFCARMGGNKGPMKTPSGKPTPKALALRRWHCESLEELLVTARQRIYEAEGEPEGLKHLTPHLAKDILDQIEKEGVHAIVKSIEWGDGGAKELINIIKRELKKVAND